jgi:hypothetical protein
MSVNLQDIDEISLSIAGKQISGSLNAVRQFEALPSAPRCDRRRICKQSWGKMMLFRNTLISRGVRTFYYVE